MKSSGDVKSIILFIVIAVTITVVTGIMLSKKRKTHKKLHQRYLLHLLRLIVITMCLAEILAVMNPNMDIRRMFLQGSALLVAIVGFAAQPAISDIVCGFLISIHKPFDIGDRIVIEGQEPGIVEDITLRHIVIRIYDDLRIIVPNSELNGKILTNTSYGMPDRRGIHLQYSVSYDTDVQKAMDIIRDCVVESPYTLSVENNGIVEDSGPVYFLKFADSALLLDTTIWVTKNTNSYTAITDINLRVNNAFIENGIEIPYNYVNVVEYEGSKEEIDERTASEKKKTLPSKRYHRTNTVKIPASAAHAGEAIKVAERYALRQRLDENSKMQLEIMCEEALGVVGAIVENVKTDFWIEGSGLKYRIHVRFDASVGSDEYKKLLNLSSTGKNEAIQGFSGKIWEVMTTGLSKKENYEWSMNEGGEGQKDLGESILTSMASDIKVSIDRERVEFIVVKSAKG